jgi:hypothetical protein
MPRPGPSTIDPYSRRPPSWMINGASTCPTTGEGTTISNHHARIATRTTPERRGPPYYCQPVVAILQVSYNTESSVLIDSQSCHTQPEHILRSAQKMSSNILPRFFCGRKCPCKILGKRSQTSRPRRDPRMPAWPEWAGILGKGSLGGIAFSPRSMRSRWGSSHVLRLLGARLESRASCCIGWMVSGNAVAEAAS